MAPNFSIFCRFPVHPHTPLACPVQQIMAVTRLLSLTPPLPRATARHHGWTCPPALPRRSATTSTVTFSTAFATGLLCRMQEQPQNMHLTALQTVFTRASGKTSTVEENHQALNCVTFKSTLSSDNLYSVMKPSQEFILITMFVFIIFLKTKM